MTPPPTNLIVSFDAEKRLRLCLSNDEGLHFVYLNDVVYAKGDGCYTTFYFTDSEEGKRRELMTSHNIGYYKKLLDYGFAQPNQSILFNLLYIKCVTRTQEVKLVYPHCLIQITPTYKKEVYEKLKIG
jgi:DNA-binding LytR/AlgR family response regulator